MLGFFLVLGFFLYNYSSHAEAQVRWKRANELIHASGLNFCIGTLLVKKTHPDFCCFTIFYYYEHYETACMELCHVKPITASLHIKF